jgi:hypothetical protein
MPDLAGQSEVKSAGQSRWSLLWPVLHPEGSVVTSLAGFAGSGSVVTPMAGFAGARRPTRAGTPPPG